MEFKNVLLALGLVFPFVLLLGLYRARKHREIKVSEL